MSKKNKPRKQNPRKSISQKRWLVRFKKMEKIFAKLKKYAQKIEEDHPNFI
jgi:acyl carrier protein phosphodiesterase